MMEITIKGDRYYLFAYHNYYPGGGMFDCELITDDLQEAIELADSLKEESFSPDNIEIFDTVEKRVVYDAWKER